MCRMANDVHREEGVGYGQGPREAVGARGWGRWRSESPVSRGVCVGLPDARQYAGFIFVTEYFVDHVYDDVPIFWVMMATSWRVCGGSTSRVTSFLREDVRLMDPEESTPTIA